MSDPHQRSLRVGLAALACALVFRLFNLGLPEKLVAWLAQPDTAAFLFYLETGRNVRFFSCIIGQNERKRERKFLPF